VDSVGAGGRRRIIPRPREQRKNPADFSLLEHADHPPHLLDPVLSDQAADLPNQINDSTGWCAVAAHLRDRFPHPYTPTDAERWLSIATAAVPVTNFAIEVGGEAVGGIGLVLGTDIERYSAEVGYWLGRALWGRGIVTAAVRGLTGYGFREFGLTRIFATVFAGHAASARVLEKASFRREGLLRRAAIKAGVVHGMVMYAVTDEG
jgi:[ribosomal protein S5]-alanine N-acetyltransferase